MSSSEPDVKHIADIVGEWGKWQFLLFLLKFLISSCNAFVNMGYSFSAKTVDFWCSDVPQEYLESNNSIEDYKCFKYTEPKEVCTHWTYNTTQFKRSIFTEFDLVCDRANYGSLTQSFFMLGYLFSGLIVTQISDKYGRRPTIFLCYTIEILGIISCGLSVNIYQFLISRLLVGVGHSGGGWAIRTLVIEGCGPKYRSEIMLLAGTGWVLGYILLPGFAYLFDDFRYLQLISAIPLCLIMIWYYFLHESPRWQITNGKAHKAEETLRKALIMNGKTINNLKQQMRQLTENVKKTITLNADQTERSHNILDLFKTPNIRKYTFIFWFSWSVNALIYYGISFNMSNFGGNFYITFLLAGVVELPGQLTTPFILRVVGRKKLYITYMLILAISCLAVIPAKDEWIKVTFALISKFAVTNSWSIVAVHATEVYPTVIRNTGIGVASVVGRIGSISSPFMGNLAMNTSLAFVMILYGVLSTIGGLLYLILPETKDKEIPDTIEEAEHFDKIQMKTFVRNQL